MDLFSSALFCLWLSTASLLPSYLRQTDLPEVRHQALAMPQAQSGPHLHSGPQAHVLAVAGTAVWHPQVQPSP